MAGIERRSWGEEPSGEGTQTRGEPDRRAKRTADVQVPGGGSLLIPQEDSPWKRSDRPPTRSTRVECGG
jgi:hypothetical protein